MKSVFLVAVVLWVSLAAEVWGREDELVDVLIRAEVARRPIPVLSAHYPAMTPDKAYRVRKAYVRRKLLTEKLAGFKAGLTSEEGRRRFGVDAPVVGALFESGKLGDGAVVERATFHRLMVETEIGLLLGRALEVPVSDPAALRRSIGAVVPVIELPDFGFADGARLEGVDIVAANVLAGKFIVGEPKPLSDIDLDEITVSLSLDGQEIHVGKGADTYGDQWRAALWLVDRVMAQGWRLEAGQILLTGVLGKILPGSPGKYVADYGRLGKVLFEVE